MCVIELKKRVKGPVVAWKLVEPRHGRFYGMKGFHYTIGKLYKSAAPGFQAFVNKKDAEGARDAVWVKYAYVVRKVLLYNAAKGKIDGMDGFSDGKPGWTARKIRIPKK